MNDEKVIKTKRKPTGAAAMGAGPGRPKGVVNKQTKQLKDMILSALDGAGGIDYLLECALDDRTKGAFLALIGKVLPMTIAGTGDDGSHLITVIERRIVKAHD